MALLGNAQQRVRESKLTLRGGLSPRLFPHLQKKKKKKTPTVSSVQRDSTLKSIFQ